MKPRLTRILRCPGCRSDGSLSLADGRRDQREVRAATLICCICDRRFAVRRGIADLLLDPPEFVVREAAGLARFAEVMRRDGWDRNLIRALPEVDLDYWRGQAQVMNWLLSSVALRPGARLVDLGSNTCWASNIFARRGLDVVAVDITDIDLQGLGAAEHFLAEGVFFERVKSTMFDLALASASIDYVFCCQVLHHNDLGHLKTTMREIHRVLRPGGRLFVLNDQLKFPLNLKRHHAAEVAEFEGNEHVHFFHQYYLAAWRAGFSVQVLPPSGAARSGRPRWIKRLRDAQRLLLTGDVNLNLVASKSA